VIATVAATARTSEREELAHGSRQCPTGAWVLAAVTAILCGGIAGAAETAGAATITRHVVAQDRAADQWSPKPGYNSTDKAMARIRCRWFAQTCRTLGSHVSRPPRTAKAGRPCDRIDGG
jgi:hypothetical protein